MTEQAAPALGKVPLHKQIFADRSCSVNSGFQMFCQFRFSNVLPHQRAPSFVLQTGSHNGAKNIKQAMPGENTLLFWDEVCLYMENPCYSKAL